MKTKTFQYLVTNFFTSYLAGERGFSSNTVISYRDCFQQLLKYYAEELNIPIEKIILSDLTAARIKMFLDYLESRGCSVSTRNQRLAAIKSFMHYAQLETPIGLDTAHQILQIRSKRQKKTAIEYLTLEQLSTLLRCPDSTSRSGFKDMLILTLLFDSGARVSEFINIKASDIRMESPAAIRLTGKGNKSRWVPLDSKTVKLLNLYMEKENLNDPAFLNRKLFLNRSGNPYTRAGITYILQKYVTMAHERDASFPSKLSPHCMRHTKAMILLQAGTNLIYIRDVLGHEHIRTTEIYARADSAQKRVALEKAQSQIKAPITENIDYASNVDLMDWLNGLGKA